MCKDYQTEQKPPLQIMKCQHGGFVVKQLAFREETILFASSDIAKAFEFIKGQLEPDVKPAEIIAPAPKVCTECGRYEGLHKMGCPNN